MEKTAEEKKPFLEILDANNKAFAEELNNINLEELKECIEWVKSRK